MKDILQEIIETKRRYVEQCKARMPYSELENSIAPRTKYSMHQALESSTSGIIAEFKRRSPSKDWIKRDADPRDIVPAYAKAGAAALSILTDTPYFGGDVEDIKAVRNRVHTPILRKEFIIDEWQILQSRVINADAVLLIAEALTAKRCEELARTAHDMDLEVLLEIHSKEQVDYINDCVDMVGVNNRNLGTFHTDVNNSFALSEILPKHMLRVSESGISDPQTVKQLRKAGFRGFLIGESFMKTPDPADTLGRFLMEVETC